MVPYCIASLTARFIGLRPSGSFSHLRRQAKKPDLADTTPVLSRPAFLGVFARREASAHRAP
jgi:hypothetical protein